MATPAIDRVGTVLSGVREQTFEKAALLSISRSLPWIIISFGIALRLGQYAFNRSLWLDEARVALNVINRSFLELLLPLDYNQGAPIGFLWIEKLVVQALGQSEYALRLFPLLSGIISLPLFYFVASRCIRPGAVPIALGLFAISDALIAYSSEVKQYSSDVAVALLLTSATIYSLSKELTAARVALFGVLGAAAIWLSHPSVFVLAGAGLSTCLFCAARRDWARLGILSIAFSLWALSLFASYLISLQNLAANEHLLNYWDKSFMPLPPCSLSQTQWFVGAFFTTFASPGGLILPGIAGLAFIIGCASLFPRDKEKLFILISPVLLTLLASGLHKYPFGGRLVLFLVPTLLLFVAEGAADIREKTRANSRLVGIIVLVFLFYNPLYTATNHLARPRTNEELKPVMSYIREHKQDGDVLYVFHGAQRAFEYYSESYGLADKGAIFGVGSRDKWEDFRDDLDKLRGNKRVWILLSHTRNWNGVDEEKFYLYHLDGMGRKLDTFWSQGAGVHLYDLSEEASRHSRVEILR